MLLDVCLACHIQAQHQPGRTACPRCGRRLTVLDAETGRQVVVPEPARATAPPSAPSRRAPMPARGAGLRWVAHRPLDTLPPRRTPRPERSARTPSYSQMPQWGLHDVPPVPEPEAARTPQADLYRALRWTWPVLGAAAAAQLLRYAILLANRSTPIPYWLDMVSLVLLLFCGIAALLAVVYSMVTFIRWLLEVRASSYALIDAREPRPAWLIAVTSLIYPINLVAAPFFLWEAAAAAGRSAPADAAMRAQREIRRVTVAWVLMGLIGTIALGYRIAAGVSDSVQTGADAMVWATVAFAAAALLAWWLIHRLPRTVVTAAPQAARPARRLVVTG